MPAPKPKPESALDEDDFVDLKRTEINLRLRMQRRREMNDLYREVLKMKEDNKVLSAKPRLVLKAGEADV